MTRCPSDALFVIDAVLEREQQRLRVEQRTGTLCRGVGVVGLYAEEDQINGIQLTRIVGCLHGHVERPGEP